MQIAPAQRPDPVVNSLSAPVGALMRPTSTVAPEDSLERVALEIRRSGNGMVPVTSESHLLGVVTERGLATALADGIDSWEGATVAMEMAPDIRPYATAAQALRAFAEGNSQTLFVTDDLGRLMGILTPSDLYPRRRMAPRPPVVGGMATPFGVYLTTGAIRAGASGYALVFTGMTLFFLITSANLATIPVTTWLDNLGQPEWFVDLVAGVMPISLFLLAMRLIPLSGTHGAEHQVVHALERGEELRPEIVRRMPRVHPRCGTNLAIGAMLFLGIFGSTWIEDMEIRFIVAAVATYFLWRPLGSLLQQHVTTKRPSDRQIQGGIRAAQELLDKFAVSHTLSPSIPQRIWRSGMLQVMTGGMTASLLVWLLAKALSTWCNVDLPI